MRIGINATSLTERPSGAKQRFYGIYGALFRSQPQNSYLIYEPRDSRVADWFVDLPNVSRVATPLSGDDRWQRLVRGATYWNRRLRSDRLDLFETLHLPAVLAPGCPTVMTVHDIRAGGAGEPLVARTLYRAMLRRSLRRVDAVVTVSNAMRAELAAVAPRLSITTIYNGVDPAPFEAAAGTGAAIARSLGLPSVFLLAVGHFEPRKNYGPLTEAMAVLKETHPGVALAIVGKDGGNLAETRGAVGRLGLGDTVHLLHDIDDGQLAGLYDAARIMVFPSTYEGFGIPLVEAMAAGCPTCVSNIPVFRELARGGAAYFPPLDPPAIARTIGALLDDPRRRREIAGQGRQRVADFGFDRLAADLDRLHRRLAGARSERP